MRDSAACADIGVLDRVDVDRQAVGVIRPVRGAGGVAAVEGGRVVGLDRAKVAAPVSVHELHAPDREAGAVELLESGDDLPRHRAVDDQSARVRAAVESSVAECQQAQARERHGAAAVPRDPGHLRAQRRTER